MKLEQNQIVIGIVEEKSQEGAIILVGDTRGFLYIQDPKELNALTVGEEVSVKVSSATGNEKLCFILPNESIHDFFNEDTGTWHHLAMIDWIWEEHDGKSGDCACCAEDADTPFVEAVLQGDVARAISLYPTSPSTAATAA